MRKSISLCMILMLLLVFTSCKGVMDKTTTLEIVDNHRHYYPILQGQKLNLRFDIKNTGEHPFILQDLISSCGCLKLKKSSINSIAAGKEGRLIMEYDSNKNIGRVEHFVILYGNLADTNRIELNFDVHVVPDPHYTKDYEELYLEENKKSGNLKSLVEGNESTKGYYMDGDF